MYMYLEYGPVSKYKIVDQLPMSTRIFGTHLPAQMVYVRRNPKDQVLSWYHFTQTYSTVKANIPPHNEIFPKEIKSFINLAITGKQNVLAKDGEGYLEHVRDWAKHKNDSNAMFLMYEDIRQDFENAVRKLCQFVEVDLTYEEIKQVIQNCSLQTMKTQEENSKSEHPIVRNGCVGDWKNYLTVYQSEYLDKKVEEVLGATDIKFKYTLHSE
uniref:amine sulfotransferase-like isoform X1 n=3 Tax=Ciona intestinalis TaxID=7719 RepID=UPI000EF4FC3D|nr:amine sulfotransferase-like isoform X1 [Ciona intestinalis]XP_026694978.1 amine sulfotransferase-like isoform X1 [Ciona intestinalis]|eukprot:XP_026694975.1 amine sulfotransferase-like isoform X1 [Ciona intestinalis]